jgi:hypothetical protein
LDTYFGIKSNKFSDSTNPFSPSVEFKLRDSVFGPFLNGEKDTETAVLETLGLFGDIFSTKDVAWVKEVIEDMLHVIRGDGMVKVETTNAFSEDGGGSGSGYCIR